MDEACKTSGAFAKGLARVAGSLSGFVARSRQVKLFCIVSLLLFLSDGLFFMRPCVAATFSPNGSLVTARYGHTMTLLSNGKILVTGGIDGNSNVLNISELYDPAMGAWVTTGSLTIARSGHTATLLPNGKVLVAGGFDTGSSALASTELYDPTTGTWTPTNDIPVARGFHTATLLSNGKVLAAGGEDGSHSSTRTAELYDPTTGTWTATESCSSQEAMTPAVLFVSRMPSFTTRLRDSGHLRGA